jgi:hypothetical protein
MRAYALGFESSAKNAEWTGATSAEHALLPHRASRMIDHETRQHLETEAEVLVVYQLDLLAQVEAQVRAVHHLMRRLNQLRARTPRQPGVALSNGDRSDTMAGLAAEVEAIGKQLSVQQECCGDMQTTIARMQERLPVLKKVAAQLLDPGDPPPNV